MSRYRRELEGLIKVIFAVALVAVLVMAAAFFVGLIGLGIWYALHIILTIFMGIK